MATSPFQVLPPVDPPPLTVDDILPARPTELHSISIHLPSVTPPNNINGRKLAEKVHYAFEAIGGQQALAVWASVNPTKFYTTLLSRMLPQGSSPVMQDNTEVVYKLSVPVKTIDVIEHEGSKLEGGGGDRD